MRLLVGLVLGVVVVAVGCSPPALGGARLTVFAASSLSPVMSNLADPLMGDRPWGALVTSTGSSSGLRTQIEQGAPADVFLSADTANPQALVEAGMTDGGVVEFASNSLVVVVPEGNPASIESPADLARPGVRIVAADDGVPITSYARQAVALLAAQPGYPADFATAYEANIVTREDNVAAVTTKIALGEGDAAIVYVTDARGSALATIELPAAANVVAEYGGVVLAASANRQAARDLLTWLRSADGLVVLDANGFGAPQ